LSREAGLIVAGKKEKTKEIMVSDEGSKNGKDGWPIGDVASDAIPM